MAKKRGNKGRAYTPEQNKWLMGLVSSKKDVRMGSKSIADAFNKEFGETRTPKGIEFHIRALVNLVNGKNKKKGKKSRTRRPKKHANKWRPYTVEQDAWLLEKDSVLTGSSKVKRIAAIFNTTFKENRTDLGIRSHLQVLRKLKKQAKEGDVATSSDSGQNEPEFSDEMDKALTSYLLVWGLPPSHKNVHFVKFCCKFSELFRVYYSLETIYHQMNQVFVSKEFSSLFLALSLSKLGVAAEVRERLESDDIVDANELSEDAESVFRVYVDSPAGSGEQVIIWRGLGNPKIGAEIHILVNGQTVERRATTIPLDVEVHKIVKS